MGSSTSGQQRHRAASHQNINARLDSSCETINTRSSSPSSSNTSARREVGELRCDGQLSFCRKIVNEVCEVRNLHVFRALNQSRCNRFESVLSSEETSSTRTVMVVPPRLKPKVVVRTRWTCRVDDPATRPALPPWQRQGSSRRRFVIR